MTQRCDNCGKPVLQGDTICWHCGRQLAVRDTAVADKPVDPEELPDQSTPVKVLVYGGITAVLLLSLLAIMTIFSRRPVIALAPETRGVQWAVVDGADGRFTLDLPAGWTWEVIPLDEGRARYEEAVTQTAGTDTETAADVATAVAPFGPLAPDTELRLIAASADTNQPGVLVVLQSDRLNRLSVADAVAAVRSGDLGAFEALEATTAVGLDGRQQARFMLRYDNGLRCVQRFVPVADTGFVASACAPDGRYPLYDVAFTTILDTFQTLYR